MILRHAFLVCDVVVCDVIGSETARVLPDEHRTPQCSDPLPLHMGQKSGQKPLLLCPCFYNHSRFKPSGFFWVGVHDLIHLFSHLSAAFDILHLSALDVRQNLRQEPSPWAYCLRGLLPCGTWFDFYICWGGGSRFALLWDVGSGCVWLIY